MVRRERKETGKVTQKEEKSKVEIGEEKEERKKKRKVITGRGENREKGKESGNRGGKAIRKRRRKVTA